MQYIYICTYTYYNLSLSLNMAALVWLCFEACSGSFDSGTKSFELLLLCKLLEVSKNGALTMEHHFLVIAPNVGIVTGQVFAAIWVCMLRTFASSFSRDTLGGDRLNCVEVMLRNLPNNYTRSMLLNLLEKQGFVGRFDFLCLGI